MSLPAEISYGFVMDWITLGAVDGPDEDRLPDARPPEGLKVTLTPEMGELAVMGPIPGRVFPQPIVCTIDEAGYLIDPQVASELEALPVGERVAAVEDRGVWLVTGQWQVIYKHPAVLPSITYPVVVLAAHTEAAPLYLAHAQPPDGEQLTVDQYAELVSRLQVVEASGGGTGGAVDSVNGQTGTVVLSAADVGALPDTYVPPAAPVDSVNGLSGAVVLDAASVGALPDTYAPPDQSWTQITAKPSTFTPSAHVHAIADVTGLQADLDAAGTPQTPLMSFSATPEWRPPLVQRNGTDTYPAGDLICNPVPLPVQVTLTGLCAYIRTTVAGAHIEIGIFADDGFRPGSLVASTTPMDASTSGVIAETFAPVTLPAGLYWVGGLVTGADTDVSVVGERSASLITPWMGMPVGTDTPNPVSSEAGVIARQRGITGLPSTANASPERSGVLKPLPLATWWKVAADVTP